MATELAPARPREKRLLTSEEFLDWLQPGVFADLIGGEIVMHSPVNLRHARLMNFIDHLLRSYLEHKNLGEHQAASKASGFVAHGSILPNCLLSINVSVRSFARPSHAHEGQRD